MKDNEAEILSIHCKTNPPILLSFPFEPRCLCLLASYSHSLLHKNPFRTLESSHNLTNVCLIRECADYIPLPPVISECRPVLSPTASTDRWMDGWIDNLSPGEIHSWWLTLTSKKCIVQTLTYLRGPPSSYGGMMTTFTVTDVLSRSIICSWVSVTAATLQISTNRLPCLSPACQAKPYSSTWNSQNHKVMLYLEPINFTAIISVEDVVWQMVVWQYLSHSAVQANMEAQLSQSISS